LICVLATAVVGCQQQINYPAPKLNAKTPLVPADIQAGKPAFMLQVFGGNFTPSSVTHLAVALPDHKETRTQRARRVHSKVCSQG